MAGPSGIRITIGTKISMLIALLLIASVATLAWLSTRMYVEDNITLIQQMNADAVTGLASQVRELLERLAEKMMFIGSVGLQDFSRPEAKAALLGDAFIRDETLLAVMLYEQPGGAGAPRLRSVFVSPQLQKLGDKDGSAAAAALAGAKDFSLTELMKGEIQIGRVSLSDSGSVMVLGIPFVIRDTAIEKGASEFSHALVGLTRQSRLVHVVGENDLVATFLVDRKGACVAHADAAVAEAGTSLAHLPIVKELLRGKFNNGQIRYVDPQTGFAKLGAFRAVGFAGLGVVAEVPELKAFEAAYLVQYRSVLLAIIVLCVSVLIGHLFSDTLTKPIYELVRAATRISRGDFGIDLKPRTRDEVGYLSRTFNEMAKGLEERDRVKRTFRKFHSKAITDKLLSGEVKLGGESKRATVLFSDIRGFTKISESMPPEAVVEMLNEYLSRMVTVITSHGGVVDKFMGDAIMAVWGVPIEREDDAEQAVRCCLAMRVELASLNEARLERGQPALRIGMGLNRGDLTAGNIGSSERMEYTVIGDAVNLASRIESATKSEGTDLLIDKSIFDISGEKFICDPCEGIEVKGRSGVLELYKVKGYFGADGKAVFVETSWSDFEPEESDKAGKRAAA